jgi:5-methylcytosine-specific restriction endonuclease McrA
LRATLLVARNLLASGRVVRSAMLASGTQFALPHLSCQRILFRGLARNLFSSTTGGLSFNTISLMAQRQMVWARKARADLIEILGGACCNCGSLDELELDCIRPMGDRHHKHGYTWRVSFYRAQHFQFQNLQILCRSCHMMKSRIDAKRSEFLKTGYRRGNVYEESPLEVS